MTLAATFAARLRTLLTASLTRRLVLSIVVLHAVLISFFVSDLVRREREVLLAQSREALLAEVELLSRSGREWVLANDLAGLD